MASMAAAKSNEISENRRKWRWRESKESNQYENGESQ